MNHLKYLIMSILFIFKLINIEIYASSEKQNSFNWETRLEYARLLSNMKKYKKSEHEYQTLLKENPDSIPVKIELAKIYYFQQKNLEAMDLLEEIKDKELTPDLELILADLFVAQKKYEKAEKLYEKNMGPASESNDRIQLKLADVQSWMKKYKESLEHFQNLLRSHPDDIQLRRKYALVLFWSGKHQEAALELEQTL